MKNDLQTMANPGRPEVYHPDKSCGPCFFCGAKQQRYCHFGGLADEGKKYYLRHFCDKIPDDSCICRAHQNELKRHIEDTDYIPKWKKEHSELPKHTMYCMYADCNSNSSNEKIIEPSKELQAEFCNELETVKVVTLCEKHYHFLYRQSHKSKPCASCGANPKIRHGPYIRHSPDPATVCQYLNYNTDCNEMLSSTDLLCKSCYNVHLAILKSIVEQDNTPHLQSDIALWEMAMHDSSRDDLTRSVLKTVIFVANQFEQGRAILLPKVVTFFLGIYSLSEDKYLSVEDGFVKFSSRWLMNQLITYLQPHMKFNCVVKKIDTLLYPRCGDLLKCLSLALYDSKCNSDDNSKEHEILKPTNCDVIRQAAFILNSCIQDDIKSLKKQTTDLTTFNLMDSIRNVNPLLWEFISLCTRSVRECTRKETKDESFAKTVRRFFIICMILFATNQSCNTLLHHLVADTIEVYGGSRQLIRVLNRLGTCVSVDTHDRFVTCVAEKHKEDDLWNELKCDTFTVASTDNIDFIQRHAAVYCGDQSRSYHGTTIQLVQPVPYLKLPISSYTPDPVPYNDSLVSPIPTSGDNLVLNECTNTLMNKRLVTSSPSNSPHKCGKVGPKRRRTMQLSPRKAITLTLDTTHPVRTTYTLDKSSFLETEKETVAKKEILKEAFSYILQKSVKPNSGATLKPLREFILPSTAQLAYSESSTVYYLDLLDENAGCDETMARVTEMVLEKVSSKYQKWVVLVGDGKTYEHLLKVKRLYGSSLENLLIFPGDWHTLKSYQEVLMKAYFHAGLNEIAKASGYRAETLKSLETCSHFKRTHSFLIQVWEALFTEMLVVFASTNQQLALLLESVKDVLDQTLDNTPNQLLLSVMTLVETHQV